MFHAIQLFFVHVAVLAVVFLALGFSSARRFFNLACPKCGSVKVVPAEWMLRKVRCRKCGNVL